ncbi:phosphotransferase [Cohnella nanjingensis]|nr:phosphotransferase [Cohnella nanjingensis]
MEYGLRNHRIYAHPSVYKKIAAYRVMTEKESFCLKPYGGMRRQLQRVCSRTERLRKLGFTGIPQWLPSKKGTYWITKNRRHYYVTEWIDGSHLGGKEEDYARLGEALARLHLISNRQSPVMPSIAMKEINRLRFQHMAFVTHLRSLKKQRNEFGQWFKEQGQQCLSLAEESWSVLSQPKVKRIFQQYQPSLIHGDVTRQNVIIHPNGLYLVDWEAVRWGCAYYELAKTLSNVTDYSEPLMKALLAGYEEHKPLTRTERFIVACLYRLPREAWYSARQIHDGKRASAFNVLTETWSKRLEMIRGLDAWAAQQREMPLSITNTEGSAVVVSGAY